MNEILNIILQNADEQTDNTPFIVNENELKVLEETIKYIEIENNSDNEESDNKDNNQDSYKKFIENTEDIEEKDEEENENEETEEIENNDNIENNKQIKNNSKKDVIKDENSNYITNIEDLVIESLKFSLFNEYKPDLAFEIWFENIKEIITEMKQYDMVPKTVKVKKDMIPIITKNLLDNASINIESYNLYDDYLYDLKNDLKYEVDNNTYNDLIYTISTNLMLPLLFVDVKQIKSEEQEILFEALKSNTFNLLSVFANKYVSKISM